MEHARDVAGVIDALGTGSPRTRRAAANALIRIPDPRASGALVEALSSDDVLLRRNAAIALGEVLGTRPSDQTAIDTALTAALADPDPSVRTMAAASLGRTRPEAAVPGLIGLLDDQQPSVRSLARIVLRGYDDPRAAEALSR
jgi:HEAT repeat protein